MAITTSVKKKNDHRPVHLIGNRAHHVAVPKIHCEVNMNRKLNEDFVKSLALFATLYFAAHVIAWIWR